MKIIKLFVFLFCMPIFAQNLTLNEENSRYQYSDTLQKSTDIKSFESKLLELGYIPTSANIFQNSFTHLVMGNFPVEISYNLIIKEFDSKVKYTFTNFKLNDHSKMIIPLEDTKSHKKKWIKNIDKKLPFLVSQF